MFKLVIFTEKTATEAALKHPPAMFPDTSFTFKADCIYQGTATCMGSQALAPMAHPCLTKVTNCTHHAQACSVDTGMPDDTVSSF